MNIPRFSSRLFTLVLALGLTSFWTPAGKGWKAEAGYAAAKPVIAALGTFHAEREHYPTDLHELVPNFLPDDAAFLYRGRIQPAKPPSGSATIPREAFSYLLEGDAYELSFSYTGPGMNRCWYDSETRTWTADGYY